MKKVLYYLAQVSLLLCSLMLGFVTTEQMALLCYSSLLAGILLMVAYAVGTKTNWAGLFLYATVACCHWFYLSVANDTAPIAMGCLGACLLLSLVFLYLTIRKPFDLRHLLSFTLFAKVALIPELLLNYLMAKSSGVEMFSYFNWVLLALTSLFAISCLVAMYRRQIILQSWAIVLGVFQFFFFTDTISSAAMLIMVARYQEPEPEVHEPLYKKSAFAPNKALKPKKQIPRQTQKKARK